LVRKIEYAFKNSCIVFQLLEIIIFPLSLFYLFHFFSSSFSSECLRRERSDQMTIILDELIASDKTKVFCHPVNELIAPDYFLTIKTPMDFSTIYKKLHELQYQSLDQFKYDG
jgi:hypothetical protein